MTPEKTNFNFGSQQMIIGNCKNLSIFFRRMHEKTKF